LSAGGAGFGQTVHVSAGDGNDKIQTLTNFSYVDGGNGFDTAIVGIAFSTANITFGADGSSAVVTQAGNDFAHWDLTNIEAIQFSDRTILLGQVPRISIAATGADKLEGNSGATPFTFTVTRSGDTSVTTTVNYAVTGSGANPADATDFGGTLPNGMLTFNAGETSKVITLNVVGDTAAEPDEAFTVTLSNASSPATIQAATAQGLIKDDDEPVVIGISGPGSAPEPDVGFREVAYTISLNKASNSDLVVHYFTVEETATANVRYVPI